MGDAKDKIAEAVKETLNTPVLSEDFIREAIEGHPSVLEGMREDVREVSTAVCPKCGSNAVIRLVLSDRAFSKGKPTQVLHNRCVDCDHVFS